MAVICEFVKQSCGTNDYFHNIILYKPHHTKLISTFIYIQNIEYLYTVIQICPKLYSIQIYGTMYYISKTNNRVLLLILIFQFFLVFHSSKMLKI